MSGELLQRSHLVKGLDPVANAFAGTVYTQGVSVKGHSKVVFYVYKGVGTTGTTTITALAGSNANASGATGPTNSTAIPFRYKTITSGDTESLQTIATTAGFATTAGSSQLYEIEVDVESVGSTGYGYVCLQMVELVASAVLGGVLILMHGERFAQDLPGTVIV